MKKTWLFRRKNWLLVIAILLIFLSSVLFTVGTLVSVDEKKIGEGRNAATNIVELRHCQNPP